MKAPFRHSPYAAITVAVLAYVLKIAGKVGVGLWINSPMISGDGFHNVHDLVELGLIGLAVWIMRRPKKEDYPFGRRNLESLAALAVGVGLFVVGGLVVRDSVLGLIGASSHKSLLMGPRYFWWVTGVTAGSAAVSFAVSHYEIWVGRKHGLQILVADGKETRSDGLIELAAFLGVCGEYLFNAPWIEYPLGLVVAGLIFKAGGEIVTEAWRTLLQKSLGQALEDRIRFACTNLRGIETVGELRTFRIGSMAVCILQARTRAPAEAHKDLKLALKGRIMAELKADGFKDAELIIRFGRPDADPHRVAYELGTRWLLCDVEDGEVVRCTLEDVPDACQDAISAWLEAKRVRTVHRAPVPAAEILGLPAAR